MHLWHLIEVDNKASRQIEMNICTIPTSSHVLLLPLAISGGLRAKGGAECKIGIKRLLFDVGVPSIKDEAINQKGSLTTSGRGFTTRVYTSTFNNGNVSPTPYFIIKLFLDFLFPHEHHQQNLAFVLLFHLGLQGML